MRLRASPRERSNLLFMLFVSLFSAFAPISVVGNMTSIGTLFAFVLVCGGIMIMRKTHPELPRPFRTPLVLALATASWVWVLPETRRRNLAHITSE